MKLKKFTMSIFLIMAMLISTISSSFAFAADTIDYTGAVSRMKQLGILDSSVSNITVGMTRGQFAKALVIAGNLIDTASSMEGPTVFGDVVSHSSLSGYVNILMNKQLMAGMADGKFHPEVSVTYSEICTSIVRLLGYSDSDLTGTWPSNYLGKAQSLKITDNLVFKKSDKITIRVAAVMFDRLLGTNIKKVSETAPDTLFSIVDNLYRDCIIEDNSITSSSLEKNEVLTDNGILSLQNLTPTLEVGSKYRLQLDGTDIINVIGKINDTKDVVISSVVDSNLNYYDNGTIKTMPIPANPIYYYHGVKQAFSNLSSLLKTDMTIVFSYNDRKAGFDYAVISDPIYSSPQVALNFDSNVTKLGDISFDATTPIIRNGKYITKDTIQNMDVIYNVIDISGNVNHIMVISNNVQGNITAFLPNQDNPTALQIDNAKYDFSKYMDMSKFSKFNLSDKISAILDTDGKIIDVESIQYKTNSQSVVKILGNSNTDNIASNQVITDIGTLNMLDSVGTLDIGAKYTLNIDNDTIVSVKQKMNIPQNYSVRSIKDDTITYATSDVSGTATMVLPANIVYYYHGIKTSYNDILASLQVCSSVTLVADGNSSDYGVVFDPINSDPILNTSFNPENTFAYINSGFLFIYRDGVNLTGASQLNYKDLIYTVSDLWNNYKYIYVCDTKVVGNITAIIPNKISPKSVLIGSTAYSFSKYFDKSKLTSNAYGTSVIFILGIDGKIVDTFD